MPNYIWTAKDRAGNRVVREITANTGNEAQARLVAEGYTDLVLEQDEVGSAVSDSFPKARFLGEEIQATAAEKLKHRGKPPATFFSTLQQGIGQSKWLILALIVLAAIRFSRGQPVAGLLMIVALAAWLIFIGTVRLPSIYYERLHRAADWHCWAEVLELVEKLEGTRKFHFIKVPLMELARFRAKALAATGHLSEGLRCYESYQNQPGCPDWLYTSFVGSIHDAAKQHAKGVEYNRKAIAIKPSPNLYLDLANRLIRYQKDPASARQAMAEADQSVISETAKPFRLRCLGIIEYRENDFPAARRDLEASLEIMEQTPHVPYRDGHIAIARAYLCCAVCKQGDTEAGKRYFDAARPYLEATGESDLLAECRKLLRA